MEQFDKTGVCRICRNIYHNTIHGHKCPEKERTMVFSLGNTDEILEGNREPAWKTSTTPLGSEIDRLRVENERLLKDLNDWKIKYIDLSYHHDTGPYEGCHCTTCKLIAENERLTRELAEAQKKLAYTIEQAADLALKLGSVMNHVHATDVSEFLASKNVYQELKESERQWEITASMLSEAEAARDTAQSDLVACREKVVELNRALITARSEAVWKPDICRGECRFCGREDCESHKPECPLAGEAALEDK